MSDAQHKQLRPGNRTASGDRIKLHLRPLRLNGKVWRVLTLRPGTDAAFSTNYFHGTWHFISDMFGARLLGRILWGMSYQREPNTIFLLHGEHLKSTPFEAEPSLPFVLIPATISAPDSQAFAALRKLLPRLPNPAATVCLQTWGLDEILSQKNDKFPGHDAFDLPPYPDCQAIYNKERVTNCGGIITYCAPPAVMRERGWGSYRMNYNTRSPHHTRMDYYELATQEHPPQGEIQIFNRYRDMLSEAAEARREMAQAIGTLPNVAGDTLRIALWKRTDRIAARRRNDVQAFRRCLKAKRRQEKAIARGQLDTPGQ